MKSCLILGLAALSLIPGGWMKPPGLAGQDGVSLLDRYDLSRDAGEREKLPRVLEEISGLAVTPDGRVFAHHDEGAVIYEVDPITGSILKVFRAGIGGLPGDFEGIAFAGGRFFLSTSGGDLLEIGEGPDGASLSHRLHRTGLGEVCEFEGLAFDARDGAFLLPCKEPRAPDLKGHLVVLSVPLETLKPYRVPRIFLPLDDLEAVGVGDEFSPSAIEVDSATGNLLLLAAKEEAILELNSHGALVAGREFKKKDHPQPEGLALLPDGTLLIADEGQGKRGSITRYERRPPSPRGDGQGRPDS